MPTDEFLVEHVARAICEQALYDRRGYAPSDAEVERDWRQFAPQAQAALEVINGDGEAIRFRKTVRAAWDDLLLAGMAPP